MPTSSCAFPGSASAHYNRDCASGYKSATPSDEIVRIDVNNDGRPDIIERGGWETSALALTRTEICSRPTPEAIKSPRLASR